MRMSCLCWMKKNNTFNKAVMNDSSTRGHTWIGYRNARSTGRTKQAVLKATVTERKVFNMKKNKLMRLASGLLVLTLMSTCAISGTYAKYVTTGSAKDAARVANFGVVINASGTLYSDKYEYSVNTPTTLEAGTTASTATVAVSSGSDNIVAPGTKSAGNGLSFGVSGTPEVAVTVAAEISAENIFLGSGTWAVMTKVENVTAENFSDFNGKLYSESSGTYTNVTAYDGTITAWYQISDDVTVTPTTYYDHYYPVMYTLTGSNNYSDYGIASAVADDLADVIAYTDINGTYNAYSGTFESSRSFAANTNLANIQGLGDLNLTWEWVYEDGTHDGEDTILGDLIAQENGTLNSDSKVVYMGSDDTSYTAVTITDHAVTAGSEDVVAYLQTSFNIELTVTQID